MLHLYFLFSLFPLCKLLQFREPRKRSNLAFTSISDSTGLFLQAVSSQLVNSHNLHTKQWRILNSAVAWQSRSTSVRARLSRQSFKCRETTKGHLSPDMTSRTNQRPTVQRVSSSFKMSKCHDQLFKTTHKSNEALSIWSEVPLTLFIALV